MARAACFPYRTEIGGDDIWACPQVIRSALAVISVPREKRVKGEFMVLKVLSHLWLVFAPLNPTSDRHLPPVLQIYIPLGLGLCQAAGVS